MTDLAQHRLSHTAVSEALTALALNLRWSFNHAADKLWEQLDPELWERTRNPWIVLQTVSQDRLRSVAAEPEFQKLLVRVHTERQTAENSETWFSRTHPRSGVTGIAYFCMEFMLGEALPIYSGGLGNVAGDQLKAACDLGVPVTAVGLLYQQGYFRQEIDGSGNQRALYPYNDPRQLPIEPVRSPNGEWVRLLVDFPGTKLWLRAWQVNVGSVRLYLLDTNEPENPAARRGIANELYGGSTELRLTQEWILGIGGWQLLNALGLHPEVCHLNEGHAAFAVLERARSFMAANKVSFDVAMTVTRAGNLFTTHTPVDAGFDRFSPDLMEKYFKQYAEKELSISFQQLLSLGQRTGDDSSEPFNMAYLAMRGSGATNGVSRLHGEVSRRIFQPLFPRWPEAEVPVSYVTNGVHTPTWDSASADALWELRCGKDRWQNTTESVEQRFRTASDSELWKVRSSSRKSLVEYVRKRHARELSEEGASAEELRLAAQSLDVDVLTIGFARRFATYKRPNLLLRDPERLARIITNRNHPVQLVLAGKAHPQDYAGQDMIRQWFEFSRRSDVRSRVIFLSDYDAFMAEQFVQGVDLWVNTPRRPWEASGTSGMKVLVNGGLNLSELDGWWAEAYSPEVGWALGDGREHGDDPSWDAAEAEALYTLLEGEIIPEFYTRDEHGIPRGWVARMRESMARLTPAFSANRAVRQYTEEHYLSAAEAFRQRAGNRGLVGRQVVDWQRAVDRTWGSLRFGDLRVQTDADHQIFEVEIFLNDLDPNSARVELYADGINGGDPVQLEMKCARPLADASRGCVYCATVPTTRPAKDYTARVMPQRSGVAVPLESARILWQR